MKIFSHSIKIVAEGQGNEVRMDFKIDLPNDLVHIKDILKKSGYKLYLVGGAVRDALLNKEPKDFDVATDALPDKVQELLSNEYKTIETGKKFGIINVLTPSGEYEIATFRKDIGSGRRPDAVEFTSIDEDVKRRDLTINALFYDIDKSQVVDLVGGIEDLKKGVIKTVGSPQERFNEDRLRILRAIRFAGRFSSKIDEETDMSLKQDSSLEGISAERIRDEFIKGIKGSKSVTFFLNMINEYDLFKWIFKGLSVKTDHFIEERDSSVLIAYLLQDNPVDMVKKELNSLKYISSEISKISFLLYLKDLNAQNAVKLKKAQKNSGVSNEQISKFGEIIGIQSNLLKAFINFELSVKSQDLNKEIKGKDIGIEMDRLETENFKNKIQSNASSVNRIIISKDQLKKHLKN